MWPFGSIALGPRPLTHIWGQASWWGCIWALAFVCGLNILLCWPPCSHVSAHWVCHHSLSCTEKHRKQITNYKSWSNCRYIVTTTSCPLKYHIHQQNYRNSDGMNWNYVPSLSPSCRPHQLLAQLLDVDGACGSVSKRLALWHCGHAQQEVSVRRHRLAVHGTSIFLQAAPSVPVLLSWPRGTRHGSFLVGASLTCLDEEQFGLPCQGGSSAACEGLRHFSQGHFQLISPKDTALLSMGKHAYHLRLEANTF